MSINRKHWSTDNTETAKRQTLKAIIKPNSSNNNARDATYCAKKYEKKQLSNK